MHAHPAVLARSSRWQSVPGARRTPIPVRLAGTSERCALARLRNQSEAEGLALKLRVRTVDRLDRPISPEHDLARIVLDQARTLPLNVHTVRADPSAKNGVSAHSCQ